MDRETAKATVKGNLESYLQGKGINTRQPFRCLNPDHEDKHPSMSYDRKRQRCKCFACGASYDIFDIIGIDYGLTDDKAIFETAYSLYGLQIDSPQQDKAQPIQKAAPPKSTGKDAAEDNTEYYKQAAAAFVGSPAQEYLQHERGISEAVASKYWVGYVEDYSTFDLDEDGQRHFAKWHGLLIPTGKDSYMVRNIDKPKEPAKKNRYRKKGESHIFNLKGMYAATKPVFVVEGEIDALSIIEAGGEAIALGSTSNYRQLADRIKEQPAPQPLILSLDSDEEGQKTQRTLADALQAQGTAFIQHNPYGTAKDANEALLTNRHGLEQEIARAEQAAKAEQVKETLQPVGQYIGIFKQHREKQKQNLRTGFKKLDIALGGGFGNELYVLGAETGTGKSAISSVLAQNIAQAGTDVLYYALEMGRDEFIARGASAISAEAGGISNDTAIKYGEMLNDAYETNTGRFYRRPYSQYEKYVQEYAMRYGEHLYIIEGGTEGTTAQGIAEAVRQFRKERGGGHVAVFVDYLQLLSADPKDKASQRDIMMRMSTAVKVLKALASQEGATVFIISSMANDRKGKAVNDASFKYSGDVSYTAGVALGWNWKGVTDTASEETKAQTREMARQRGYREMVLEVLKQRSGEIYNRTELLYYPAYNYITEATGGFQQTAEEWDVFAALRKK